MQDLSNYKVVDRKKFAVIMVALLSAVSIGVWVSLDRLAEYATQLRELVLADPAHGAQVVTSVMRVVAMANGVVLSSFATLIIWHGWKGWRTASMPPKGSWILEGQRTWSGEPARRIAMFTVVVGVLLAVLAVASSLTLWDMSDMLINQTLKRAGNR